MSDGFGLFVMIFLGVIVSVGLIIGFVQLFLRQRKGNVQEDVFYPDEPEECCGEHATCEKDSLLAAVSSSIEYFDDEELDQYVGRDADGYGEDESEEFREILYTLKPEEVPAWVRSLQLRSIAVPDAVRDELLLIVCEQRSGYINSMLEG